VPVLVLVPVEFVNVAHLAIVWLPCVFSSPEAAHEVGMIKKVFETERQ
jgi:hypothetical protein